MSHYDARAGFWVGGRYWSGPDEDSELPGHGPRSPADEIRDLEASVAARRGVISGLSRKLPRPGPCRKAMLESWARVVTKEQAALDDELERLRTIRAEREPVK